MRNNRGVFVLASAIVWSGMIWGMAQMKPGVFKPNDTPAPPPIVTVPIDPVVIPPPPPRKKDETEEIPTVRPPPMAANPTRPRGPVKPDPYHGPPPSDGIIIAGAGTGTAPIFVGPPKIPEATPLVIASVPDSCEEEARNPRPLAQFNVERAYPTRLEEQEITGLVHAVWEIDANGLPVEVRIHSSSNSGFNDAVVAEGMKMRFRPARKECENIKGIYALNVKFEITGEQ